jgi:outer membrane protein assembly factor BamB/predicted negative regulator of RcsB-dependent stress response
MPAVQTATTTSQFKGLTEGSRLWAVNIETGNRQWVLGAPVVGAPPLTDEDEDNETNPLLLMQNSFFLGPPLALNGKLYVLFERNGRIRLACLDPNTIRLYQPPARNEKDRPPPTRYPELLWTQKLGEPNTRLPLDTIRRFQCSYLAYADGVMICPTNAGAIVAVDVMSRSLLWAQSYRFIKQPENPNEAARQAQIRVLGPRGFQPGLGGGQSQLTADRWRAAAPIISNGRVVFAAFDSDAINCLDLRTGTVLWTEPRRPGDLYVGGVIDDKVIVVGKESVRAIHLVGETIANPTPGGPKETPRFAWKDLRIGTPAGHGAASQGGIYYIPLATTPDNNDPAVWAIDVTKGEVVGKATYRQKEIPGEPKPMLGNLVFHEGQLFSQSPTEIAVFPLLELKEKEMNRLLKENPKDPVGLVARGELLLDRGKWREAVADFQEAQRNNPPDSIRQRLRDKLYVAYTELLRKDFSAAESFLPEYEQLCEVPIDTDDPDLRQKLIDEQFKRQTLYLALLAKGRESQGRLAEAFDHYRKFAALGDGKQLVSVYDEPNTLIRPDVWSRGRIEAMIRSAKDPAVRGPLEQRVANEWEAIRSANDLPRLREFVQVFGPYFKAGREGQLLLAQRLIETNNEDDIRDAQKILLQVRATTEDRTIAARAMEMLARLMIRSGMLEDAVGLYTRLGTEYPDVTIREGKTGADFLNDLLTDKRLLPYLEPTRLPTPARIKVEQMSGAVQIDRQMFGITFEPDGELMPFFQRFRLSLHNEQNNQQSWALRVSDRNTGEERWKCSGLRVQPPGGGFPQYRIGSANGHLLLLNLGHMAYCFDLAGNEKLWEYNLLGESSRVDPNTVQFETGPDGETTITYMSDGFKIRFGRSTVLEANYACLLTRDGLVAVEPTTGTKLWVRSDIALSAQVFGDARHIFVVESEGGEAQSRVLRASDGAAIDGVPPFGGLFTGKSRVRVHGRMILLNEGGGDTPRVVRLYDPLTGANVWSKQYQAGSKFIDTPTADFVGVIEPTGQFEILDSVSGKVVFASRLDENKLPDHLAPAKTPTLLYDAERFYLLLNRNEPLGARNVRGYYPYKPLRDTQISGPVYAFDRASGRRLWYTDKLFENQLLLTERFADTPALIAATQITEPGTNLPIYRVIVVDKQNGKIRFLKSLPYQGGIFSAIVTDPSDRSTRLIRNNETIRILPDEPELTAAKP